ncbi:hypothetical protein VZT92_018031 [Zoarces viviparus]|uniref:Uncharacterized protein n=1 Tax=Zoarces viviparus TaxID=48416 RepID=A0AAW1EQ53_ZOAVI
MEGGGSELDRQNAAHRNTFKSVTFAPSLSISASLAPCPRHAHMMQRQQPELHSSSTERELTHSFNTSSRRSRDTRCGSEWLEDENRMFLRQFLLGTKHEFSDSSAAVQIPTVT